MSDWTIRVGGTGDAVHVGRCLYLALSWNPDTIIPPIETVLAHPEVVRYHAGWGRPGDALVVAEGDAGPIGYAFARMFDEKDHGHGYVDPSIPEMGIGVEPGHRAAGVGTALMEALHDELRSAGCRAVSLSVDEANPARRLYSRLGYREVSTVDGVVMVLELS